MYCDGPLLTWSETRDVAAGRPLQRRKSERGRNAPVASAELAVGRALTNRSSPKRSDRAVAGGVLVEGDSIVWVLRSFARGFRRLLSSRSKGLLAVRPAEQLWFPTK